MCEKVQALLRRHKTAYGDLFITEFDDKFLRDHVHSVSLCDTDILNTEKQVFKQVEIYTVNDIYLLITGI